MFGIGSTELLLILVVALIVLGPKSLASVSRTLGKAVGEFRRVSTEFQRTLNFEAAKEEEAARQTAARKPDTNQAATPNKSESEREDDSAIPEDSPLGQAIAKAKAQAAQGSPAGKTGENTGGEKRDA